MVKNAGTTGCLHLLEVGLQHLLRLRLTPGAGDDVGPRRWKWDGALAAALGGVRLAASCCCSIHNLTLRQAVLSSPT